MNTPNKLTVIRLLLVPVFLISAYSELEKSALLISTAIFVIASITDFLDGYIARKDNLITDFGKFMDPLADKVLVAAALLVLIKLQRVEAWAVLIIVAREYAISIIRAIAAGKGTVIAASGGGKLKTVLQMTSIVMLLLSVPFAELVFYISVGITLYSGFEYIIKNRELIREK